MVLSYSRRAYSEAVWRQDTESFIRCLENAFHHFGGVPPDAGDRQPAGSGIPSRLVLS